MDGQDGRQMQSSIRERSWMNGMRLFFRTISGMGFITAIIGMSAMDSAQVALPITMIFAGIGAYIFGSKMEADYG